MRSPKLKPSEVIFAVLFLAPFVGVGGWAAWMIASEYQAGARFATWQETTAHVIRVTLEETTSGSSDASQISAQYRYEFAGKSYEGTRVGTVESGGFGLELSTRYETLAEHRDSKQPAPCSVNPDTPREAVSGIAAYSLLSSCLSLAALAWLATSPSLSSHCGLRRHRPMRPSSAARIGAPSSVCGLWPRSGTASPARYCSSWRANSAKATTPSCSRCSFHSSGCGCCGVHSTQRQENELSCHHLGTRQRAEDRRRPAGSRSPVARR